ncbi:MAG TPA: hypothetical protein VFC25_15235 [Verrucomicrobiae bacterium]|nr:hypothetical protein [Verrucomicrobiae bacterium]
MRPRILLFMGALLPAWAGQAEVPAAAQSFVSVAAVPSTVRTGERLVFRATLQMPQDCAWRAAAALDFGAQPELGGTGWGLTLTVSPGTLTCVPGSLQVTTENELGLTPVASGPAIARLVVSGSVADTKPFTLTVNPGPAPGFLDPAADARLMLFVQTAGIASYGDLVAIADNLHHEIQLLDPPTETVTASFRSPGNGNVRALATDGDGFFAALADTFGPRLYHLNEVGGVLDSWSSPVVLPGPLALEAIAWKDGILYGAYPSPPILFAINPATHQVLWQRSLPARFTGFASVPAGFVGVDAGGNFYFVEPGPAGGSQQIADLADTGFPVSADFTDLTWDGRGLLAFEQNFASLWWARTYALWWAADGTLRAYAPPGLGPVDVIRGDLGSLHHSSGNVELGPTVCLMADGPGGVVADGGGPPAAGHGFFYLARFEGFDGFDTSWGRGTIGFRRVEQSAACP